jgi:hypothetical protein
VTVTLQEYLVDLGFHVDQVSFNRFLHSVKNSTSAVMALGAETVATSGAIVAAVEKVAATYEDLFYLSQRTGQSVASLQVYGFAARQVGLSAGEARSSIEGFYHAIRTNPGVAGLARGLGASTPEQLAEQLKSKFGEKGYFAAQNIAGTLFEQDEVTFRKYWDNAERFRRFQGEYNDLMHRSGLETRAVTDEFYQFTTESHRLGTSLEILGTRIATDLLPTALSTIKWVKELVDGFSTGTESTRNFGLAISAAVLSLGKLAIPAGVWEAFKVIEDLNKKESANLTGGVDREKIAQMPWYRRWAAGVAEWMGADPRQWASTNPKDELANKPLAQRAPWAGGIGNTEGMNPEFVRNLEAMRAAMPAGTGFSLTSGYRSQAEQDQLYANRAKNPYPVAKNSEHTLGTAADFHFNNAASEAWIKQHGGEYGTTFPLANDPIHGRFNPTIGPQSGGGAGGVSIHQKTDIHVTGGDMPIAGEIAAHQDAVNSRLVRSAGDQLQ